MTRLARNLLFVCLLLLPLHTQAQPAQEQLRLGLIPEMNVFSQMERYAPLADYLSEQLELEVEFVILRRYGNIIDRFRQERLDGAFLGSFTGAMALQQLNLVPLVRPVNLDGESTYHGFIYTRKDSGITSAEQMRGKRFAFVEKATTAGFVFPLAYLKAAGVNDLDSFFSEYFFAGSHDASLIAVLDGKADIGASKNTVFDWVRKSNPRIDQEIIILADSARVPSNGLSLRPDLPAELMDKLKTILLNLDKTDAGRTVLEKLKAIKFIETNATDYQPVFEMSEQAGIDLSTYHYKNR